MHWKESFMLLTVPLGTRDTPHRAKGGALGLGQEAEAGRSGKSGPKLLWGFPRERQDWIG